MLNFFERNKRFAWAFCGYAVIFAFNCVASLLTDLNIGYDNLYYWHLFEPLMESKPIELWRGYIFPFYLLLLNKAADGGYGYYVFFNSLLNSFMFMHIIPCISTGKIDMSLNRVVRNVVNYLIAFFFFRGLFIYLAYNIRTIYLFAGVACFFMSVVFIKIRNFKKMNGLKCVAALLFGFLFASIPQGILNYRYNKVISPLIPTQGQMFWQECVWGLEYQKYDTYAGDFFYKDVEQDKAQMFFVEPVGVRLLEEAKKIKNDSGSNFQAALYIVQHPFEMLGIYFRHFANLLFPCWPNQYIMKINNNKAACAIAALVVIYLFALSLSFRSYYTGSFFLSFLPALVACLFIVPGAVESRFFLAVFLFMVSCLLYNTDIKQLCSKIKCNALMVVLIFMFFSAAMVSQWTMFLMSETEIPIYMLGR